MTRRDLVVKIGIPLAFGAIGMTFLSAHPAFAFAYGVVFGAIAALLIAERERSR